MSANVGSNSIPPCQLSIFHPSSHRCSKGIGGVQPGARCIWTSSHRCLRRPDFFLATGPLCKRVCNVH